MVILKEHDATDLGNKLRPVPSYYNIQLKKRQEIELAHDTLLKEGFLEALGYYEQNYPKSNLKVPIKWEQPKEKIKFDPTKTLKENLELAPEKDLHLMRLILQYSIKEHNYKLVSKLENYKEALGLVVKLIPGGKFIEEQEQLKEEIFLKQNRQEAIKKIIQQERQALNKRLSQDIPEEEGIYACEECGKVCKSKAGLTSHMKTHELVVK